MKGPWSAALKVGPALLVTCATLLAFRNSNATPVLLHRYSLDYAWLLAVMCLGTAVAWRITRHEERLQVLRSRLESLGLSRFGRLPWFSMAAIVLGFVAFLGFTVDELPMLHRFILHNINALGAWVGACLMGAVLILSSPMPGEEVRKHALLIASLGLSLLAAEIGFRVMARLEDRNSLHGLSRRTLQSPAPWEPVPLGRVIRVSPHPRIIYELIPDLRVTFQNARLTTNALGFRGSPIPMDKGPHSCRIVGLGDSLMFGWGVKDDETYLARMGETLAQRYPALSWEILNTAVPGYNTVMEVAVLEEEGLRFRPDIVLIHYVCNDLDLPAFIREEQDYFTLKKSFFKQFHSQISRGLVIAETSAVPSMVQEMTGLEAYSIAMRRLKALSLEHGFAAAVVAEVDPPSFLRDLCEDMDMDLIDVQPVWDCYAREHGIEDKWTAWRVSLTDGHPSPLAHRIIASAIQEHLEASGLIEERVNRGRGKGNVG